MREYQIFARYDAGDWNGEFMYETMFLYPSRLIPSYSQGKFSVSWLRGPVDYKPQLLGFAGCTTQKSSAESTPGMRGSPINPDVRKPPNPR